MDYKKRNIIILSIFVLVIGLTAGYFALWDYPRKLSDVNSKIQDVDQKIAALQGIEEEIVAVQEMIEEQKKKLSRLDKQLTDHGSPAETYRYINTIMNYSGVLDINLSYVSNQSADNYRYDVYRMKGEGFFPTIYKFLWYLERGPQIYKIKRVSFRGVENREIDSTRVNIIVPFEIEFWNLFTDLEDVPPITRNLRNVRVSSVRNPFLPFIYQDLPLNSEGLLEAERATLKGILPGKAFIEDRSGEMHVMAEGDRVYLGYVSKIDAENNQVLFILNKGGIVERFSLKLGFE